MGEATSIGIKARVEGEKRTAKGKRRDVKERIFAIRLCGDDSRNLVKLVDLVVQSWKWVVNDVKYKQRNGTLPKKMEDQEKERLWADFNRSHQSQKYQFEKI